MIYRNYKIERRWTGSPPQPDEFSFFHQEYDGLGDRRCGYGRTLAQCIELIDELECITGGPHNTDADDVCIYCGWKWEPKQ